LTDRPSLDRQLAALMHAVAWAGRTGLSETVLSDAEYGVESMQFLTRYQREFKALIRTLQAFPDAELVEEGLSDDIH